MNELALDPCCGSRMFYANKQDSRVIFGDCRREVLEVTDNSKGNKTGKRTLIIDPDIQMDFRNIPFDDCTFSLVTFDPPHLIHAGPKSWLAAKYGRLSENWREDIKQGFSECFRVLKNDGVLIFKWNETQVKVSEVLRLTDRQTAIIRAFIWPQGFDALAGIFKNG
ncbi:class I SAM-dependent methyltransferase [Methylophilus sp. QUAN]|uniref:class I SAM-dependent methyltransferase n=1 Tax=Methylophilus sp. QUAN TaxID=2781020 RepID=UPI001E4D57FB|nr:class I SAM-dependent methyltransferase [Methylophilus sp. QUAN]